MKHIVKSTGLMIHTEDGREKEIPLEVWQMDIVAQMLGLAVNLSDLNDYRMSPQENVEEHWELYCQAIRNYAEEKRKTEADHHGS